MLQYVGYTLGMFTICRVQIYSRRILVYNSRSRVYSRRSRVHSRRINRILLWTSCAKNMKKKNPGLTKKLFWIWRMSSLMKKSTKLYLINGKLGSASYYVYSKRSLVFSRRSWVYSRRSRVNSSKSWVWSPESQFILRPPCNVFKNSFTVWKHFIPQKCKDSLIFWEKVIIKVFLLHENRSFKTTTNIYIYFHVQMFLDRF